MKKRSRILCLAACLALMSFSLPGDWITYTSEEGHYSVSFPGKPEELLENGKTPDSVAYEMHFASYTVADNEVYMVGWLDMTGFYPKEKSLREILEDSREGAAASLSATYVKTVRIDTTGNPCIEFTFNTGEYLGKDRIYIIGKYQYSLIAIFPLDLSTGNSADKFIASFRHLD